MPDIDCRSDNHNSHSIGLDSDRGLDQGTWSVQAHMYPAANIPVVQLSINGSKPLDYHVELGARLSPLRDRGILIVASVNVVHNLRRIDWAKVDAGFDWAERFDDAVHEQLAHAPAKILAVASHPDYGAAVPTPEHFIPTLYHAGLGTETEPVREMVRGYSLGSLSMSCYAVGIDPHTAANGSAAAATLPTGVPADNTNA